MQQYLKDRIQYLERVEIEYFDKQYEYPEKHPSRIYFRNFSNELCRRRDECEIMLLEFRKKAGNLPPVSGRAEIIKKLIQDANDLKNTMREIELNSDVDRSRGKEYQEIKTRLSNLLDGIELIIDQNI